MTGGIGIGWMRGRIALALVALALLLRVIVPAGFMPAAGQGFAITLCTGMGAVAAWVDGEGHVHKGKPASGKDVHQPCAFAGAGLAAHLPDMAGDVAVAMSARPARLPGLLLAVAIGRGLAAPPPPSTGPPPAP